MLRRGAPLLAAGAPARELLRGCLEHEPHRIGGFVQSLAHLGARALHAPPIVDQLGEASHDGEAALEGARVVIGGDAVVVAPITGARDALDDAALLEASRIDADARAAHRK